MARRVADQIALADPAQPLPHGEQQQQRQHRAEQRGPRLARAERDIALRPFAPHQRRDPARIARHCGEQFLPECGRGGGGRPDGDTLADFRRLCLVDFGDKLPGLHRDELPALHLRIQRIARLRQRLAFGADVGRFGDAGGGRPQPGDPGIDQRQLPAQLIRRIARIALRGERPRAQVGTAGPIDFAIKRRIDRGKIRLRPGEFAARGVDGGGLRQRRHRQGKQQHRPNLRHRPHHPAQAASSHALRSPLPSRRGDGKSRGEGQW